MMTTLPNRKDFPVGSVVFHDNGVYTRVVENHVAVLFDYSGNVCELVQDMDSALSHVQNGYGAALALKCDYGENINDVQDMLDYHYSQYSNYLDW